MAREIRQLSGAARLLCGAGIGVLLFLVVLFTVDDLGMTFDEPVHLALEANQRAWWRRFVEADSWGQRRGLFSETALRAHFDVPKPDEDGRFQSGLEHSILGRHAANLSNVAIKPWVGALVGPLSITLDRWLAARLATAMLFGLLGATMFVAVASRYGAWGGATAAAALALMPRVFGHFHLDTLDPQVAAWWFLSYCAFFRAMRSWPATLGFALLVGLAWGTQFSGILVLVPLAGWAVMYRRRDAVRPLLVAALAAPLVLLALSPHWWHDPIGGMGDFVSRSTSRRFHMAHACYYLGRRYEFGLPWHNAFVLAAATVPLGLLALSLAGMVHGSRSLGTGVRRWFCRSGAVPDDFVGGLTLVVFFWLALRALPASPDHDGVRLYLHAFVFLAALAGVGAAIFLRWATRGAERGSRNSHDSLRGQAFRARRWAPGACLVAALACAAFELCWIHPYHLSYYNRLVGHPAGAQALGFESTYWNDAITPEVVDWINRQAPTTVYGPWTPTLITLSTLGHLQPGVRLAPANPQWLVIISRQSNYDPEQRAGRHVQPELRLIAEGHPARTWSTRDGVPLVRIYEKDSHPPPHRAR